MESIKLKRQQELERVVQYELKLTQVNWNESVEKAVSGLKTAKGLTLEMELGEVPPVRADHEKLLSVFTNLVLNASEALDGEGRIRVSTRTAEGYAVATVSDNGHGMSADFLRRELFRPFRTTKKKGLGIGMFQSRMIVEAHKGRLDVQSVSGVGTTVEVWVPIKV